MKFIIFFSVFFLSSFITFGQKTSVNPKAGTNKIANASKNLLNFKKVIADSSYLLNGDIMIESGHGKFVKVSFKGYVERNIWDSVKNYTKGTDGYTFELITTLISLDAQLKLKNKDSFEPLTKQFFSWDNESNTFISNYKMMGRNGYGNLTETTALATYDPFKPLY